ncbi:MAG: DRTGG domain-containing protein [Oscillospiraceae bacterium]
MTPIQLAKKYDLTVLNQADGENRKLDGIYCCDLLSFVMGRAKENDAWITVMGNTNSIAVAVLSDVSCIILSEGVTLDSEALQKAISQNVCVLKTQLPTFEISQLISKEIVAA